MLLLVIDTVLQSTKKIAKVTYSFSPMRTVCTGTDLPTSYPEAGWWVGIHWVQQKILLQEHFKQYILRKIYTVATSKN